jgi:predicted TIM-barrel fold metal-dependent hydrolase
MATPAANSMDRIDTHLHLLYPDHFRYDWTSGFPMLDGRAFRLEDFRADSGAGEITASIFMEVDVPAVQSISEAAFFCALAEEPANRICGVIAACRPEDPDFAAHLEACAHPRLVGYRRVLHTQPDELSTTPRFRDNIALIGRAGLTFDLCLLPRQLATGAALVDACPDTRFILDHCGVPDIASGDLGLWRDQLREVSKRPNLSCKISGIIAYAGGEITAETLRPVVEHTIECFGWDRVVWGSDWPVCNLTRGLRAWKDLLDGILAECADPERAALYGANARRIYRLHLPD